MIHNLKIDMEKECRACGMEGATDSDLCLRCSADKLMAKIGGDTYTRKDTRTLPVQLTAHEIEEYGKELAAVIVGKGKLEAQKAVLSKAIKPLVERLEELAPVVDSGKEDRDVACRWYYDWANRERFLIRSDTLELVATDIIPEGELQQRLDLGKEAQGD